MEQLGYLSQAVDPRRFPEPDDVFLLRVSLIGVKPAIWRRLLVPKDVLLPQLHSILQVAMGWTNSHLHQFMLGDVTFAEPSEEDEPPGPIDYRQITLSQIAPRRGSKCFYEYDFGDGWGHRLEVEEEIPVKDIRITVPACVGGERACPPEDCGGPHGYAEVLRALRHARHPEHDRYVEWVGSGFDPEAFDVGKVNDALARFAARRWHATRPKPRRRGVP